MSGRAAKKSKWAKPSRRMLTDEQVAELRASRSYGVTLPDLAAHYGISTVAAFKIIHGVTYAETHPAPNEDLRAVYRLAASVRNNRKRREAASP